ncbi:MAG: CinA family nicotinamide mononucleotide deamidase-related protein [Deltaproteobacteria bacterium]|nr:CinA family nicotinamide mononucleotide deamidase-related protein [Deltaproteobacteria bacterium]NNK14937.1 CinA family nicotinamide mononucleotide deamidase-related protein [Desulfofustis sp.]
MKGEIIAIGDELTSGRIMNTTSGFAARKLFDAGYTIHAMSTIGDTPLLIGEALLRAIKRVDFIIVTGGLGSTDDDLTNVAVSLALDRPTMPNLEILAKIRSHLSSENQSPDSPLEKLAWLPGGAEAFDPHSRIAGYQIIHDQTPIFFLPGVPSEMQQLMSEAVLPRLAAWEAGSQLRTCQRIYKIFGIPETRVNKMIKDINLPEEISIGYYPVFPDVHLSLLVRGTNRAVSKSLFNESCRKVENVLEPAIYGSDRDDLETIVGTLLQEQELSLAVAESCSGGLLSHRITRIPGSSNYFFGGAITYSNEMKQDMLGIDQALIEMHGAVSREIALAMASKMRERSKADVAMAITGIAGPGGGSTEKPVGTVFIAISGKNISDVTLCQFSGSRHRIQTLSAHTALNILRLFLVQNNKKICV